MHILTNGIIRLAFDPEHGTIQMFQHEPLRIDLVRENRLAENFRLLLPLPHWRGHFYHRSEIYQSVHSLI